MDDKIVDLNRWKIDHGLLFGLGILGNDYLELTAINAIKARGMELTQDAVKEFQEVNDLIDTKSNNAGVIDVKTFIYLIDIFNEDEDCILTILDELRSYIDYINKSLDDNPSFIDKVKNFFSKKKHNNK